DANGIVVTVGPGLCAIQSLDSFLYFMHDRLEIFYEDIILYVEG
ncbi:12275_t:CDS:1, partial [Gigaspora margarita]